MKFMLIRRADANTENGAMPSQEMLADMAAYNQRMTEAGVFLSGDGLHPTSEGCLIRFEKGEPTLIPGPLSPASERIAGYSVLEAPSLQAAIEWAQQWPTRDADGNVTLELRRYFSLEDFEPGAGIEQHRNLARVPDAMNVHVAFPGTCREAMQFYADVTGGQLECLLTYAETPAAEHTPPALHDRIIHASLNLRGRRLMGADMAAECYTPPQGVEVQLEYHDIEQAARTFAQLAEGGKIIMPFEATFWSPGFGMATDRFGVGWMVNVASGNCPLATEGDSPMKYVALVYYQEQIINAMSEQAWHDLNQECIAGVERLSASGHYLGGQPLQPTETATTVRVRDGETLISDGPFAETKEQLAGFYLLEAHDLNEALQLASRIPPARLGSIEVRPVRELPPKAEPQKESGEQP